jgi:hypothetical protein
MLTMMKKLPLLVTSVLGLILLPWHLIIPVQQPYREDDMASPATVVRYRQELAAKGLRDDRADYFVIQEIGRQIVSERLEESVWKKDPALMKAYKNIEWANRERSYFVRLLENLYGSSGTSLLRSKAWIVPVLLALVYGALYASVSLFTATKRPNQDLMLTDQGKSGSAR